MAKSKQSNTSKIKIEAVLDGNAMTIRIVDYIGAFDNDSTSMRQIVDNLIAQNYTSVEVYLNSQGGDVLEATEIVNELQRLDSVHITVGALAASAATYITSQFPTTANANSQFMIHKPMMSVFGNEGEVDNQMKLLQNLTADYKAVYMAKTGMSDDEIEALWNNGDYWMNAEEALAKGFIDDMIEKVLPVDDNMIALLTACGAPSIPEKQISNFQISNMDKLELIALLGLPANATDDQIKAKAKEMKIKADAFESEKENAEKLRKERAVALVDNAILAKKLDGVDKDTYVTLATANYDAVASLLLKKTPVTAVSGKIEEQARGGQVDVRANWTMSDWQEKDPTGLTALFDSDREKFNALQKAYNSIK